MLNQSSSHTSRRNSLQPSNVNSLTSTPDIAANMTTMQIPLRQLMQFCEADEPGSGTGNSLDAEFPYIGDPEKMLQMKQLLTESRKNEIKRQIGQAFLDILKQLTIKKIIGRKISRRTDWETQQLISLIRGQDVFRKQRLLKENDMRQIAKSLTYLELNEGDHVWRYGDPAEYYYIVLRGKVSVEQPNEKVKEWSWVKEVHEQLLRWIDRDIDTKLQQ